MPADKTPSAALADTLAAVIALSSRMVDAARAGEWDRLAALETERSRLLEEMLASRPSRQPVSPSADVKAALATCLRLNDEITALTGAHMTRLGALLTEMSGASGGGAPPQRPPG